VEYQIIRSATSTDGIPETDPSQSLENPSQCLIDPLPLTDDFSGRQVAQYQPLRAVMRLYIIFHPKISVPM
jgi:hypothetical protein